MELFWVLSCVSLDFSQNMWNESAFVSYLSFLKKEEPLSKDGLQSADIHTIKKRSMLISEIRSRAARGKRVPYLPINVQVLQTSLDLLAFQVILVKHSL